ncbi:two-component system sensor histidine kinase YesM [Metabacillus crassostreae]|uniref:sensor histidine kinase n=1 Tax=Metabacillus crassostreae TaxID=929098 RepID=UPI001959ABF5|nr:histidine kinase [Metabacillus crassostreae]MBM7603988.1 two-component system sensor histidine kinase YesM [Metabacillus crassostreae]
MNRIKNYFNNMKLHSKLVFSFVIAVIIPLLIVGSFLTHELRSNALTDAKEQVSSDLERVKKRTAETLEKAIYVSNNLTLDHELKEILNTEYKTIQEVVSTYNSYHKFEEYLDTFSEISNIRVYTKNETMLNNWRFIPEIFIEDKFWYHSAKNTNGLIGWYYIQDETKYNEKYLSLVRNINYTDYKLNALLVINVNNNHLYDMLSQERTPVMIIDDNNYIAVSNRKEFIGKKLNEVVNIDLPPNEWSGSITGMVDGEESEVLVDILLPEISSNKLRFVSVIPQKVIMEDANKFLGLGLIVIVISLIIAILLISFFSKLLSKRILKLGEQIDIVSEGNLNVYIQVDGEDEIGLLSYQLNYMVKNIKELIDEVDKAHRRNNILEKRQQEIKLKMMASQINPHFLFNALESIRMKAHMKGEKEIAGVVKLLGKLMRKSISVTGEMVTLQSEIELVTCYLEIQKFRYGNRLSYSLTIDPLSEGIYIHPLIIQPLVENSVLHGLEDKSLEGRVEIITKVIDDELHVCVSDNGNGIAEEKLRSINNALENIEDNRANRIGLVNVHQRLILTFGKQSGLTIKSQPNIGTEVAFVIPVRGSEHV